MSNKIELLWAVLCSGATIDQETKAISIVEVIEQLQVEAKTDHLPSTFFVPRPVKFVSMWYRDTANGKQSLFSKVIFRAPDGDVLKEVEAEMELQAEKYRHRHIISFDGIPLRQSGQYTYEVLMKQKSTDQYKKVGFVPLNVEITLNIEKV